MIVVHLSDGLGNQMFQYSMARRLALIHGQEPRLDVTAFWADKHRHYGLGQLNIKECFATYENLSWLLYKGAIHREVDFTFDARLLKAPPVIFLTGFFQSEKYFSDIADILRADFTPREDIAGPSIEIAAKIKAATKPTALHIRRGDRLSVPRYTKEFGTPPLSYYARAVEQFGGGELFVFSDDPAWAQANLKLSYPTTFVSHNDEARDFDDLRLMSLCRNHVIANSSFSWWGAWLSRHADKRVIAPDPWFANRPDNTKDLLPPAWQTLPVDYSDS